MSRFAKLMSLLSVVTTMGLVALQTQAQFSPRPERPAVLPAPGTAGEVFLGVARLGSRSTFNDLRALRSCGLTHVRLEVVGGGAEIDVLEVIFADGSSQVLNVRERFKAGTSSRWIDLAGGKRCVNRIRVIGRSNDGRPGDTQLLFFGRSLPQRTFEAVFLGRTQLSNGQDWDDLNIRDVCGVHEIKLAVRRGHADIDYLALVYANGVTEELKVRSQFGQGSESRWIDLSGGARCVSKIQIVGKSDDRRPGQTVIEFYGRK